MVSISSLSHHFLVNSRISFLTIGGPSKGIIFMKACSNGGNNCRNYLQDSLASKRPNLMINVGDFTVVLVLCSVPTIVIAVLIYRPNRKLTADLTVSL